MWKYGLFFILVFLSSKISAQNHVIAGTVKDAETANPIGFCSIVILNSSSGITADANGKFKLSIPGKFNLQEIAVSYLGYKTDTITILAKKIFILLR